MEIKYNPNRVNEADVDCNLAHVQTGLKSAGLKAETGGLLVAARAKIKSYRRGLTNTECEPRRQPRVQSLQQLQRNH